MSVLWVQCAGCGNHFSISPDNAPIVFVCTGCSNAASDPRHCRSREVLERLAAALQLRQKCPLAPNGKHLRQLAMETCLYCHCALPLSHPTCLTPVADR